MSLPGHIGRVVDQRSLLLEHLGHGIGPARSSASGLHRPNLHAGLRQKLYKRMLRNSRRWQECVPARMRADNSICPARCRRSGTPPKPSGGSGGGLGGLCVIEDQTHPGYFPAARAVIGELRVRGVINSKDQCYAVAGLSASAIGAAGGSAPFPRSLIGVLAVQQWHHHQMCL
jgi:hypothetical protein